MILGLDMDMSSCPVRPQEADYWFALAYGEKGAQEAAQLPEDLRRSLYGEVEWFGPAALEIGGLVKAIPRVGDESSLQQSLYNLNSYSLTIDVPTYDSGLGTYHQLVFWDKDQKFPLSMRFDALTACFNQFLTVSEDRSIHVLLWFLTGQYTFDKEALTFARLGVDRVNSVLNDFGMPDLGGRLSLNSDPPAGAVS